MIDWNGDGKIDPTDIGITIALLESDETDSNRKPPKSGCLTACLMTLFSLVLASTLFD